VLFRSSIKLDYGGGRDNVQPGDVVSAFIITACDNNIVEVPEFSTAVMIGGGLAAVAGVALIRKKRG
jgi:hypothetical protein